MLKLVTWKMLKYLQYLHNFIHYRIIIIGTNSNITANSHASGVSLTNLDINLQTNFSRLAEKCEILQP